MRFDDDNERMIERFAGDNAHDAAFLAGCCIIASAIEGLTHALDKLDPAYYQDVIITDEGPLRV